MNTLTKSVVYSLYKYTGVMHAQECFAQMAGRRYMAILLLHRVTDDIPEDGLTVSTAWFRGFCAMMQRTFHVVPLTEIQRLLEAGQTPPQRTVAITFDDCYRDNLFAARVLADHGLPATFFLPPAYVGTDHVFPWDHDLKRMPNLDWNDVREMIALGHDIGSHTMSHADLGTIGATEARFELRESKKILEDRLQCPVRWLAYPYGGRNNFRPEYLPLAFELGYKNCFSGFGGFIHAGMLGKVLPREPVPQFRSLLNLELHLRGCLHWFYQLKKGAGIVSY